MKITESKLGILQKRSQQLTTNLKNMLEDNKACDNYSHVKEVKLKESMRILRGMDNLLNGHALSGANTRYKKVVAK